MYSALSDIVPALFPPRPMNMTASFLSSKPLGKALVQGVEVPLDAAVGWLSSCLSGADGWLAVVIKLA
jgi:autophagy-related protein 5